MLQIASCHTLLYICETQFSLLSNLAPKLLTSQGHEFIWCNTMLLIILSNRTLTIHIKVNVIIKSQNICRIGNRRRISPQQTRLGMRRLCRHNFRHNRHAKASSIMPAQ